MSNSRRRHIAATLMGAGWRTVVGTRFGFASSDAKRAAQARELSRALESLGPTFVKIGQILSVRPDIASPEMIEELSALRDDVTPLPFDEIRPVIEDAIGPVERNFSSFETTPLATASIAQVYKAKSAHEHRCVDGTVLPAGTELAVKVVRPGAEQLMYEDMAALMPLMERSLARGAFGRLGLSAILGEISESLEREFDLRIEGRASDRFRYDFGDDPLVTSPRIIWPLSSCSVLTMEYMDGWMLDRTDEMTAAGVDSTPLAAHGAIVFMRQVLELGRFHADLHPSNLLVTRDGRIAYIDFGIAGSLTSAQRDAVAHVLLATVYADPGRAIRYSRELGLAIPEERVDAVTKEISQLMGRTLGERTDIRGYALGFLRVMARHGVTIPEGFGLLVKGLVTVEGCARLLDPDVDIIAMAKPYTTSLVARRLLDPRAVYKNMPRAIDAAVRELLR